MFDHAEIPILIVDDDDSIILLIQKTLEAKGFKNISVARSGEEAIRKLRIPHEERNWKTAVLTDLSVVILDIVLPDMNGLDLCVRIKDKSSETLVILVSGFDIQDLHRRLIESNADDFLTKPFSPLELVARIDLLLEKHHKNNSARSSAAASAGLSTPSGHQVPHVGDKIDNYFIIDTLGWSKASVIYKVVERPGNKIYALKLLTRYSLDFEEIIMRFKHEVEIMSSVSHPNVIKFHKMGVIADCPYLLMDYVAGINLEEYLVSMGIGDLKTIFSVALQTASGIQAIHEIGIVHRDIKPKNIMIETDPVCAKLTDFGIAKYIEESNNITRDGFIVGTPLYMAPEIFRGDDASVKADIYSYGVSIYQFAAGVPPFTGKKNSELYEKHIHDIPRPIASHNPEIPKEFDELITRRCMAKSPGKRPASMQEILDKLNAIKQSYDC
ncbi:MAG: hypothetical protein A2X49_16270 [Lentisphaerae bacterium GWF2_52_8]|nr:MAG: hypothetical protein A2X49_16270 [Lentisphaerae bacterium GWF2_52_8]